MWYPLPAQECKVYRQKLQDHEFLYPDEDLTWGDEFPDRKVANLVKMVNDRSLKVGMIRGGRVISRILKPSKELAIRATIKGKTAKERGRFNTVLLPAEVGIMKTGNRRRRSNRHWVLEISISPAQFMATSTCTTPRQGLLTVRLSPTRPSVA